VRSKITYSTLASAGLVIFAGLPLSAQTRNTDSVDVTTSNDADYNGPLLPSRDSIMNNTISRRRMRLRPFLDVSGIYDSSITEPTLTPQGTVPQSGSPGVEAKVGLIGSKAYKQGSVSVDYRGDYRDYVNTKFYNGMDHFLTLSLRHNLSKHVMVRVEESFGSYARAFDGPSIGGFVDPMLVNNPATDIFDSRTNFSSTRADVILQASPRLSFDLGGVGFTVRRRSPSLVGVNGYDAHGDAAYRWSRRLTTGVYYRFTQYNFARAFGSADMHTVGVEVAYRITKQWEVGGQIGGSRLEAQSEQVVTVDPLIAAITGQTLGVVASHKINYVPDFRVHLARQFRSGTLAFNYSRTVNPGNGVYLTSQYETVGGSLSYSGFQHWTLGLDGGYDRYASLVQSIGPYKGVRGGLGFTRTLYHNFHTTFRADYRRIDLNYAFFRRDQTRFSLGVAWSPGEMPLVLW
jgi:hypothetical protein